MFSCKRVFNEDQCASISETHVLNGNILIVKNGDKTQAQASMEWLLGMLAAAGISRDWSISEIMAECAWPRGSCRKHGSLSLAQINLCSIWRIAHNPSPQFFYTILLTYQEWGIFWSRLNWHNARFLWILGNRNCHIALGQNGLRDQSTSIPCT